MSEEHSVSRRATLKGLGAMGAAVVLGGVAPPAGATAGINQDKPAVNIVDVAVGRMAKGHS